MKPQIAERILWAVKTLEIEPDELILEIGCGAGDAVGLICPKLSTGKIIAIDRSEKMIERAEERNAENIKTGKAELRAVALAEADFELRFNKIFAVNVNVFWLTADRELSVIKRHLAKKGCLYLFYEPPVIEKTKEMIEKLRSNLSKNDFPVKSVLTQKDAVCVVGQNVS